MSHKQPLNSLVNDKNQDQNAHGQTDGHSHPFKQYALNFYSYIWRQSWDLGSIYFVHGNT